MGKRKSTDADITETTTPKKTKITGGGGKRGEFSSQCLSFAIHILLGIAA